MILELIDGHEHSVDLVRIHSDISLALLLSKHLIRLNVYVVELLQCGLSLRQLTDLLSALPNWLSLIQDESVWRTSATHRRWSVEDALRVIEVF